MKKLAIDEFLSWAFTQELCKVGTGSYLGPGFSEAWSMMSEVALLGTVIDRSPNGFGVIPDYIESGDPHPDAMKAGRAVKALADLGGFEIGAGWNALSDFPDEHGVIAAGVAQISEDLLVRSDRLNGKHVVNLVISSAILGRGPDWSVDEPKVQMIMRSGKPAWFVKMKGRDALQRSYTYEGDGFDRRKQRPVKGAYRKFELASSIRGGVLSRLDWQLWQDALADLHSTLSGELSNTELLPFYPDRQPWMRINKSKTSLQTIENA